MRSCDLAGSVLRTRTLLEPRPRRQTAQVVHLETALSGGPNLVRRSLHPTIPMNRSTRWLFLSAANFFDLRLSAD